MQPSVWVLNPHQWRNHGKPWTSSVDEQPAGIVQCTIQRILWRTEQSDGIVQCTVQRILWRTEQPAGIVQCKVQRILTLLTYLLLWANFKFSYDIGTSINKRGISKQLKATTPK